MLRWIKALLSNRTQKGKERKRTLFKCLVVLALEHYLVSGVPQGSGMGPAFFILLFINDISSSIQSKLRLFQ